MSVSADEPREKPPQGGERSDPGPGESLRARRESSGPTPTGDDDTRTGIIRRAPTGPIPKLPGDARTGIIRRAPTGPMPKPADDAPTTFVPRPSSVDPATGIIRPPRRIGAPAHRTPSGATAIAAASVSIVNGWATAVVATDLITGWWRTDRLFCVGVGFLSAVCAASIIAGVIQLLLRRRAGVYLTLVGAVLAVLIFAGIFVTGAHVAGVVLAMPVLPAATALLVLLPATWRWCGRG